MQLTQKLKREKKNSYVKMKYDSVLFVPSYGDNTYSHAAHSALKSLDVVLLYFSLHKINILLIIDVQHITKCSVPH